MRKVEEIQSPSYFLYGQLAIFDLISGQGENPVYYA